MQQQHMERDNPALARQIRDLGDEPILTFLAKAKDLSNLGPVLWIALVKFEQIIQNRLIFDRNDAEVATNKRSGPVLRRWAQNHVLVSEMERLTLNLKGKMSPNHYRQILQSANSLVHLAITGFLGGLPNADIDVTRKAIGWLDLTILDVDLEATLTVRTLEMREVLLGIKLASQSTQGGSSQSKLDDRLYLQNIRDIMVFMRHAVSEATLQPLTIYQWTVESWRDGIKSILDTIRPRSEVVGDAVAFGGPFGTMIAAVSDGPSTGEYGSLTDVATAVIADAGHLPGLPGVPAVVPPVGTGEEKGEGPTEGNGSESKTEASTEDESQVLGGVRSRPPNSLTSDRVFKKLHRRIKRDSGEVDLFAMYQILERLFGGKEALPDSSSSDSDQSTEAGSTTGSRSTSPVGLSTIVEGDEDEDSADHMVDGFFNHGTTQQ